MAKIVRPEDFDGRMLISEDPDAHRAEIQKFIDSDAGNGRLKNERALLATALEDANAIVGHMINDLMSADASNGGDLHMRRNQREWIDVFGKDVLPNLHR